MVIPRFVDQALAGGPIIVYDDGGQVRCFAHVKEVIEAVHRLTETPAAAGKIFNIGSDKPISVRQLAEAVAAKVNRGIKIETMPYHVAYGHDFEDVRRRVPDVSRLRDTLGKVPTATLDQILDEIIAWKKAQS